MFAHGDEDPRPLKSWLIKHLIPACGHGLLSGQWGAGKTFVVFDPCVRRMSASDAVDGLHRHVSAMKVGAVKAPTIRRSQMQTVKTIGLDIAKSVFRCMALMLMAGWPFANNWALPAHSRLPILRE